MNPWCWDSGRVETGRGYEWGIWKWVVLLLIGMSNVSI